MLAHLEHREAMRLTEGLLNVQGFRLPIAISKLHPPLRHRWWLERPLQRLKVARSI